jgi:alanyl-tRNA synthetase
LFSYDNLESNQSFISQVLTAESSKISEQIQESCQAFEQVLIQLHRRRMLAQTAVLQVNYFLLSKLNRLDYF